MPLSGSSIDLTHLRKKNSEFKTRSTEIIQTKIRKEKNENETKASEQTIQEFCGNIKHLNICISGILEWGRGGGKKEGGGERGKRRIGRGGRRREGRRRRKKSRKRRSEKNGEGEE